MIQRECGVLKTSYEADMGLYPLPIAKWTVAAVAVVFFLVIPLTLHEYFLSVANLVVIVLMLVVFVLALILPFPGAANRKRSLS